MMEQFQPIHGLDSTLLVSNLPDSIDDGCLREIFTRFGEVLSLEVLPGKVSGIALPLFMYHLCQDLEL